MSSQDNSFDLRVLYVGDLTWWGTCLQRLQSIEDLGHHVVRMNIFEPRDESKQLSLRARVMRKLGFPLDFSHVNRKIVEIIKTDYFDILWLDKALLIKPETLRLVREVQPSCKIIGYTPDDMSGNRSNQSFYFRRHLQHYDIFFTTKTYGVLELQSMGCKKVIFVGNSFDPTVHRPVKLMKDEKNHFGGTVGFIGAWEPERSTSILALAKAGFKVRVWGKDWKDHKLSHNNIFLEDRYLLGDEYAKGICSFDINLAFLRKVNRDLQTTRSIEIPACGSFMLAERTSEHQTLFQEGIEAEYFGCDDELIEKVRYYLAHPEERLRIAAAGLERCLNSGYSVIDRMKYMLHHIYRIEKQ